MPKGKRDNCASHGQCRRQHQEFPEDRFISLLIARSSWRKLCCVINEERELVQWHMQRDAEDDILMSWRDQNNGIEDPTSINKKAPSAHVESPLSQYAAHIFP